MDTERRPKRDPVNHVRAEALSNISTEIKWMKGHTDLVLDCEGDLLRKGH